MMTLNSVAIELLDQVKFLCNSLTTEQFTRSLNLLNSYSIGEHVRHILEHYECLFQAFDSGKLNYDERKRDLSLQSDKFIAINKIQELCSRLQNIITQSHTFTMSVSFPLSGLKEEVVETSYRRELLFNIDHTVHHLAIIKIALNDLEERVDLPSNFGVAQSTLVFQKIND